MTTLDTALPAALETVLDDFLSTHLEPVFRFRTLDANQHTMPVINGEGLMEPRPVNPARIIPGATKIRGNDGRQVKLLYSVRERLDTVNGASVLIQEPEPIVFEPKEFCVKTVGRNERELLARLLLSNECQNGINPAKEEPPTGYVYELIQPAKNAEQLVINQERVLDAKIAVRQALDSEVKLACERLSLPATDDRNTNASTLYSAAETNPEGVFRVLGDEWDKTTVLVRDLTAAGIIAFDDAARTYRTVADQKAFHNVIVGDFESSLVKYLSDSQGQKTKTALTRLLEEKTKKGGKR